MNPTTSDDNLKLQFWEMKRKFREAAREQYPGTPYPEMAWLFDQVLGMDPREVVMHPIRKKSYLSFVLTPDGQHRRGVTGEVVRVRRKFTPEQQKLIRQWWVLLPQEMLED